MAMYNEYENNVPAYELDDGPLTDAQYEAIRVASSASSIPPERFTRSIFGVFAEWKVTKRLKQSE